MLKHNIPYGVLFSPAADGGEGGGSGGPQDDNNEPASSAGEGGADDGEGQSLEDVVQEAADAHSAEDTEGESGSKVEPDKGEKGKEGEGKKDDAPADGKAKDDDGKELPPFHEHPRWQEMVQERNTLREQVKGYEEAKPLVESQRSIVQFCQANNVSPQDFQEALQLAALLKNDPAKAREMLAPVMERLSEFDGSRLPKDLETDVAEGNLSLERAQEIAQLRAQTKGGEFRGRIAERDREQAVSNANMQAVGAWEQNMMSRDPDFKPKADANAADGKYELTVNMFRGLMAANPPRSPNDIIRMVEQAYQSVDKVFKERLTPKKPVGTKRIPSSKSSPNGKTKEPESLEEAIAPVLEAHGIN